MKNSVTMAGVFGTSETGLERIETMAVIILCFGFSMQSIKHKSQQEKQTKILFSQLLATYNENKQISNLIFNVFGKKYVAFLCQRLFIQNCNLKRLPFFRPAALFVDSVPLLACVVCCCRSSIAFPPESESSEVFHHF